MWFSKPSFRIVYPFPKKKKNEKPSLDNGEVDVEILGCIGRQIDCDKKKLLYSG